MNNDKICIDSDVEAFAKSNNIVNVIEKAFIAKANGSLISPSRLNTEFDDGGGLWCLRLVGLWI